MEKTRIKTDTACAYPSPPHPPAKRSSSTLEFVDTCATSEQLLSHLSLAYQPLKDLTTRVFQACKPESCWWRWLQFLNWAQRRIWLVTGKLFQWTDSKILFQFCSQQLRKWVNCIKLITGVWMIKIHVGNIYTMRYCISHPFMASLSGGAKRKINYDRNGQKKKVASARKPQLWKRCGGKSSEENVSLASNRKVLHCWTSALLWLSQLRSLFAQITSLSKPKHTHVDVSICTSSKYFFSLFLSLHLPTASSYKRHAVYSGFPPSPFLFKFFPIK